MRCLGITQKGAQCARSALPGSSFCWQQHPKTVTEISAKGSLVSGSSAGQRTEASVDGLSAGFDRLAIEDDVPAAVIDKGEPLVQLLETEELNISFSSQDGDNMLAATVLLRYEKTETAYRRSKSPEPQIKLSEPPNERSKKELLDNPSTPTRRPRLSLQNVSSISRDILSVTTPSNELPPDVDESLGWDLTSLMDQPLAEKDSAGYIYLCKVKLRNVAERIPPEDSKKVIIKIGKATNVLKRLQGHKNSCHYSRHTLLRYLPPGTSSLSHQVRNVLRVEQLIHMQLRDKKYGKKCGCGKNHQEFFEIDEGEEKLLVDAVEWWVGWSEKKYGGFEIQSSPAPS